MEIMLNRIAFVAKSSAVSIIVVYRLVRLGADSHRGHMHTVCFPHLSCGELDRTTCMCLAICDAC